MEKKKNVKSVVRTYPVMVQFIFHLRRELSVPVSSVTIKKIEEYSGTDFEHVEFEPILLKDAEGVNHEFHFTVRHLGDRIGIDSFEIDEEHRGGYEFSLIGDIEDEIFKLFGKLFERMRKALERKHIEWDDTTNRWQISEEDVVRARISSDLENDENYGHPPLIVIDGYLFTTLFAYLKICLKGQGVILVVSAILLEW